MDKNIKAPTSLRNAFIRISASNQTQNGEVCYTRDDIIQTLREWSKDKKMTWYAVEHEDHFHVVAKFGAPTPFSQVKNKFPYGSIQNPRDIKACVQYLVHKNNPEKTQYSWDDVTTNDPTGLNKYKGTERLEDRILNHITKESVYCDGRDLITRGVISQQEYTKKRTFIRDACSLKLDELEKQCQNRHINVVMIYGHAGTGKSSFIKLYCDRQGWSYSDQPNRDPIQGYRGEDVLVLNDFEDKNMNYKDFQKLTDPYHGTLVGSRNRNKPFLGHTIIITTNIPIEQWYEDEFAPVDFLGNPRRYEDRTAFLRRIHQYLVFTDDEKIHWYKFNDSTKQHEFQKVTDNPINDNWRYLNNLSKEETRMINTVDMELETEWLAFLADYDKTVKEKYMRS